jgi:co-chaperonin GroES (HSP10)
MKCYSDFIVQVPKKYRDTIKTESGVELFVDSRWNLKDTVNTIMEIHELPFDYDGPIKKGDTVFVDATIFMEQIYQKGGKQENIYLIDRKTFSYKLKPNFIIAYKPKDIVTWTAYGENVLIQPIKETKEKIGSILLPQFKEDSRVAKGKVFLANPETESIGVDLEQEVYYNNYVAIDVKFNDQWLIWVRNKDLLATIQKDAA